LIPVGDSEALAHSIMRLLNDPTLRETFALASRKRAEEEFSLHRIVSLYLALYQEALS